MVDQSKTSNTDKNMSGSKGHSASYNAATDKAEAVVANATNAVGDAVDSMATSASKVLPEARDIASRVVSATNEFANQYVPQLKSKVSETVGQLPKAGREVVGKIDRQARANPWLHIGLAGVGAFAIGYLLGRQSTNMSESAESTETSKAKDKSAFDIGNTH